MKKIVMSALAFAFRHRYKIAGTMFFVIGFIAVSKKDYVEFAAWMCALSWMDSERLSDKRADESERAVSDLMYILHKVAKGEASASVDGNSIKVRPADAGSDGRGWPKEADHA